MSATAGPSEPGSAAGEKLGLTRGQVVQELGWDEDVDDELRVGVEDTIDGELVEEAMDAVDVVLLWWRDDDGDLIDGSGRGGRRPQRQRSAVVADPQDRPERVRRQLRHLRGGGDGRPGPDHLRQRVPRLGGAQAGPAPRHQTVSEPAQGLQSGASAPDFSSRNQYGQTVSLSDLRGAPTVLIFYPWAFSSICTGELRSLRDRWQRFDELGARVVAISCDAMFTLRAYADAEGLAFDLLTDHWPHGGIARAYGVFDEVAGCALRGSFLLDADGVVRWSVVNGIGEARDLEEHLAALSA